MATAETGPTSSLVAIREVMLPNVPLRKLRSQLKVDARHTLGSRTDTAVVPTALDEIHDSHDEIENEDVEIFDADFFSLHSLRVVTFARRARASTEANRLLRRSYYRITGEEFFTGKKRGIRRKPVAVTNEVPLDLKKIQRDEGFPNGILPVTVGGVANVSALGATEQVYSLMIREGPPYVVLEKQHEYLEKKAKRIQALKLLDENEGLFDHTARPLGLDIIRLPGGQNRETQKFELAMNIHDDVDLVLGSLQWQLKLGDIE